jgi:hypothetical protein
VARDLVLIVGLLVVLVATVLVVRSGLQQGNGPGSASGPRSGPATGSVVASGQNRDLTQEPPARAPRVGSYVESHITAKGLVRVTQWIRSTTPVTSLDLAAPAMPSGTGKARATDLVVAADRRILDTPTTVGPAGRHLTLKAPATVVFVRYTLHGVVERSGTVPGRALARAIALDVRYRPRTGPVRISLIGGQVLSTACAATTTAVPYPCGTQVKNRWNVLLRGAERTDAVMAQVNLS